MKSLKGVLLLLLLGLNFYVSTYPIVLDKLGARVPKITKCVNPDIPGYPTPVFTECYFERSNGCNVDYLSCILSPFIGYGNNTQFLDFTFVEYAEMMPSVADGALKAEIAFNNQSILQLQGFLQLWRYSETVDYLDLYEYIDREWYLSQADYDVSQGFYEVWFNDLSAGKYVMAYFDAGGTRYGLGVPEMSEPFTIYRVFPIQIPSLRLEFMPEANVTIPPYGIVFPDTLITVGYAHYFSYRITAEPEVPDWLLQQWITVGNQSHYNRPLAWEVRTDQGNIFNVKTYVEYYAEGPNTDTMFKMKVFPANTGGYVLSEESEGTGVNFFDMQGRPMVIYARFNFHNRRPFQFSDYWTNYIGTENGRQYYGFGTVAAYKIIDIVNYEFNDYPWFVAPLFEGQAVNIPDSVTELNNMIHTSDDTDTLQIWFFQSQSYSDSVCVPNALNFGNCPNPYNQNNSAMDGLSGSSFFGAGASGTGELLMLEDFYQYDAVYPDNFFGGSGTTQLHYESHGARYEVYYQDHTNALDDANDYSCAPVGTTYAVEHDNCPPLSTCNSERYTMADINYGLRRWYDYMSPYECDGYNTFQGNCDYAAHTAWTCINGIGSVGMPIPPCEYVGESCTGYESTVGISTTYTGLCEFDPISLVWLCVNFQHSGAASTTCVTAGEPCQGSKPVNYGCDTSQSPTCACVGIDADWISDSFFQPYSQKICPNLCQNPLASFDLYLGVSPDGPPSIMTNMVFPFASYIADEFNASYWCWGTGYYQQSACVKDTVAGYHPDFYNMVYFDIDGYNEIHANHHAYPWNQNYYEFVTLNFLMPGYVEAGIPFPTFLIPPTSCNFTNYGSCQFDHTNILQGNVPFMFNTVQDTTPYYVRPKYTAPRYGTFGYDIQMATVQSVVNVGPILHSSETPYDIAVAQSSAVYARYKVWPTFIFQSFTQARPAFASYPDSIVINFRIICPLVETGYSDEAIGYCAEACTIINQHDVSVVIKQLSGPSQNLVNPPYINWTAAQNLGPTMTNEQYAAWIEYNEGDVLQLECMPRTEPEKVIGQAHCIFYSADTYAVPLKSLVFQSMVTKVATATPVCVFSLPEVQAYVQRDEPFIYQSAISSPFINDAISGQPADGTNIANYYTTWTTGTGTIEQGFNAQDQVYSPPMTVTICSAISCKTITNDQIILAPVNPLYPDPLYRPPTCLSTTTYATCDVNAADNPAYSGIDTFPTCDNGQSYTLMRPRLKFLPGYSIIANVGSIAFTILKQFITPEQMIQMTEGPFVQITNFVIVASNFVAMLVRYGKTIASVLTTPCIETYTTYGIILEPFVLQPLPLQRIPGCTLANQCCYTVPFEVFGNSPFDTGSGETIVNMDNNLTNPCYGTPACSIRDCGFSSLGCRWWIVHGDNVHFHCSNTYFISQFEDFAILC